MRTLRGAAVLVGTILSLAACGNTPVHREWSAKGDETARSAYDECDDELDSLMRLRGYPTNPLPETPQFAYRKAMFAQCMRRKGYEAEE